MNIQVLRDKNNQLLGTHPKYEQIAALLAYDDCFFRIAIETSYQILRDLGFAEEEIPNIYATLINVEEYQKQFVRYSS